MGGNIVELFPSKPMGTPIDPVKQFMQGIIDWCENEGIDTNTTKFQYNAAVIMSTLQAMLVDEE